MQLIVIWLVCGKYTYTNNLVICAVGIRRRNWISIRVFSKYRTIEI